MNFCSIRTQTEGENILVKRKTDKKRFKAAFWEKRSRHALKHQTWISFIHQKKQKRTFLLVWLPWWQFGNIVCVCLCELKWWLSIWIRSADRWRAHLFKFGWCLDPKQDKQEFTVLLRDTLNLYGRGRVEAVTFLLPDDLSCFVALRDGKTFKLRLLTELIQPWGGRHRNLQFFFFFKFNIFPVKCQYSLLLIQTQNTAPAEKTSHLQNDNMFSGSDSLVFSRTTILLSLSKLVLKVFLTVKNIQYWPNREAFAESWNLQRWSQQPITDNNNVVFVW